MMAAGAAQIQRGRIYCGAALPAWASAEPSSGKPAMARAAIRAFCSLPTPNTSCCVVTGVEYPGAASMVRPTTSASNTAIGFAIEAMESGDTTTGLIAYNAFA